MTPCFSSGANGTIHTLYPCNLNGRPTTSFPTYQGLRHSSPRTESTRVKVEHVRRRSLDDGQHRVKMTKKKKSHSAKHHRRVKAKSYFNDKKNKDTLTFRFLAPLFASRSRRADQ